MSDAILKALDSVEAKLKSMSEKADAEMKDLGKVSADTKAAIDNLGIEQRALADRLLQIEQKQSAKQDDEPKVESWGEQFVKAAGYGDFQKKGEQRGSFGLEVKNTVTNAIANTFSERRPGIVEGAFRVFTIEDLLVSIPTSANAIDWIRENVFTNAAAETAEGVQLPQSSITFTPGTMPVSAVGHFVKITRQLAMDNAALAAYINRRMVYGVNLKVENQLVAGNGTAPNLNGLTNAGNFTAHGYTAATLTGAGLANNKFDLIGKMIGDCALADYPADVVILNTGDWWTLRLAKDSQGRYILGDPGSNVAPMLFGRPVVASNAMVAGKVWVGSLSQAATLHNRAGIALDLSDSDENNFQLQLVTIRATRRLALTVEKPAAARYGDLVPA
ncbi:phage major capsid protein [Massilia sp.]|uniref:phage major capsid protein n=1 Tax=Massilia sp. TaxID=1882437 RepID=UPI00352BF240